MRTIYIEPGETLIIRLIADGLPKNEREWAWQSRPEQLTLHIKSGRHIAFASGGITVEETKASGETIKFR
jgi:hypothetical protein